MADTEIAAVGLKDIAEKISIAAIIKTFLDIAQFGEEINRRFPDKFKEELNLKSGNITEGHLGDLTEIAFAVSRLSTTTRYMLIESLAAIYNYLKGEGAVALTDKEFKACEGILSFLQKLGDKSQKTLVAGLDAVYSGETEYVLLKIDGKESEVFRFLQVPPGMADWLARNT